LEELERLCNIGVTRFKQEGFGGIVDDEDGRVTSAFLLDRHCFDRVGASGGEVVMAVAINSIFAFAVTAFSTGVFVFFRADLSLPAFVFSRGGMVASPFFRAGAS
jgi:hypothetical protein